MRNIRAYLGGLVDSSRDRKPLSFSAAKVVAAVVGATWFGLLARKLVQGRPPVFSELTSGYVGLSGVTKAGDYILLPAAILGFACALIAMGLIGAVVAGQNTSEHGRRLDRLLVLSSLPLCFEVGTLFLKKEVHHNLRFANLSALLIGLVLTFALVAVARQIRFPSAARFERAIGGSILAALFSGVSVTWILLFWNRVFLGDSGRLPIEGVSALRVSQIGVIGTVVLAVLALWLLRGSKLVSLESGLRKLLTLSQIGFPLGAISLMPAPWETEGTVYHGFPTTSAMVALVAVVAAAVLVDGIRRAKRVPQDLYQLVTPLGVILLIVAIKHPVVGSPGIGKDDFHLGERLLPFWQAKNFGSIPFWDFTPARGLANYVDAFLSWCFVDEGVAAVSTGTALSSFLFISFGIAVLRRHTGLFLAFLMMTVLKQPHFQNIFLLIAVCLVVSCRAFLRGDPVRFLVTWFLSGVTAVLFAPAQGAALALATLPLVLCALSHGWSTDRLRVLRAGLITVGLFILASVTTPLGRMVVGAVRYISEQGSINIVAHGLPWLPPGRPLRPAFELARASFIAVAFLAFYLVASALLANRTRRRRLLLTFAIPILLLLLMLIPTSVNRIDWPQPSRLGRTTHFAVVLLAPLLLSVAMGRQRRHWVALTLVVSGATLYRSEDFEVITKQPILVRKVEGLVSGESLGMPGLGKVVFSSSEHRNRLVAINSMLKRLLQGGEEYLDLSSRGAHYRYFERPAPISTGAVYNLSSEAEQKRAVARLSEQRPRLALAEADNLHEGDGGPPSLRAHYLYRFLLDNYEPVEIGGFTYLILPELRGEVRTIAANGNRVVPVRALSEDKWRNGISRRGDEVLLAPEASGVRMGSVISFRSSGRRKVVDVRRDVSGLAVRVAGESSLDFESDGAPHSVTLIESKSRRTSRIWNRLYRKANLQDLPRSWGRSITSLSRKMSIVADLRNAEWIAGSDAELLPRQPSSPVLGAQELTVDVSKLRLSGRDADLLLLELESSREHAFDVLIRVRWTTREAHLQEWSFVDFSAGRGSLVVPLDSVPSWRLSKRIRQLKIGLVRGRAEPPFSLSSIRLARRIEE